MLEILPFTEFAGTLRQLLFKLYLDLLQFSLSLSCFGSVSELQIAQADLLQASRVGVLEALQAILRRHLHLLKHRLK